VADGRGEVSGALAEVAGEARGRIAAAYGDAQRTVLAMMQAGKLDESQLGAFARNGQFEHAVAALSAFSRVPIEVVERLMRVERSMRSSCFVGQSGSNGQRSAPSSRPAAARRAARSSKRRG